MVLPKPQVGQYHCAIHPRHGRQHQPGYAVARAMRWARRGLDADTHFRFARGGQGVSRGALRLRLSSHQIARCVPKPFTRAK